MKQKQSKGKFKTKEARILLGLTFGKNISTTFISSCLSSYVSFFSSTVIELRRPLLTYGCEHMEKDGMGVSSRRQS